MTSPSPKNPLPGISPSAAAVVSDPKLGFQLRPLWALYILSLRQFLHGKRPLVIALLFILTPALVVLVRATTRTLDPASMEFSFVFLFIPQAMLPLVALIYSLGILQDEQEGQTLTYILIRPISKWGLYLVKLLSTITMAVALTSAFTALTFVAIYAGIDTTGYDVMHRCLFAIGIHSLSIAAYCSLFGLISLLTRWTLIACVMYTGVVELLLANLPFSIRLMTVIYYARVFTYRSLNFFVHSFGQSFDIAAETWQFDIRHDPLLLEHPQARTCLIVLSGATVAFACLGALLCWRREFYVKTPEQA